MRAVRSVRFWERVDDGVHALARHTGRDVSSVVNELLDEALKMRRIPGIVFTDTQRGRTARLGGTGLAVHEIVRAYRDVDRDWERLRQAYHWLSDIQLRRGLAYAEAYPEEIEDRLARDDQWTPERLWETYPFMRPELR
ncbi:MAG: hypothetical protein HW416_2682 [Chloroflexi bacterium]|nr:hypothetical protein [Chloroflexota bacterium]